MPNRQRRTTAAPKAPKPPKVRQMSALEEQYLWQVTAAHLPVPEQEVVFARPRRWRFDFLFNGWLAVEIEGGTMSGRSRHTTGKGFQGDCEKYAEALLRGYSVLRVTSAMVADGRALHYTEALLQTRTKAA